MSRGGRREGAGRPRKPGGGIRRYRLVVSEAAAAAVEARERRPISQVIERLLEERYPDLPWRAATQQVIPADEGTVARQNSGRTG